MSASISIGINTMADVFNTRFFSFRSISFELKAQHLLSFVKIRFYPKRFAGLISKIVHFKY
jgi:hypothetical protein